MNQTFSFRITVQRQLGLFSDRRGVGESATDGQPTCAFAFAQRPDKSHERIGIFGRIQVPARFPRTLDRTTILAGRVDRNDILEERLMAGIYVHIPFCKKRCLYCDFFSTTLWALRKEYVEAVLQEIQSRRDEAHEAIRTIYLGGGTPSTLEATDIQRIIAAIGTEDAEEITMELNPGDATPEYLRQIREAGINRLSMGVQSFNDHLLQIIGRRHNAAQAIDAVHMAQEAGFDNISIDLMYALPTQTMTQWEADIETALQLEVQHISCYGLMYEEGTALSRQVEQGLLQPIDEETENEMYDFLCKRLEEAELVHYEVSN